MQNILWVGIGGFVGSALRYGVVQMCGPWRHSSGFGFGTLLVNVVGCFFIGLLGQLFHSAHPISEQQRAFAFTGLLGGFTTYSAFGHETIDFWRNESLWYAGLNIALHLFLGLGAVVLGRYLALRFSS